MQSAETKTSHLNVFLNKCLRKHAGRENTSGGEMLLSARDPSWRRLLYRKYQRVSWAVVGSAFQQSSSRPGAFFFFFYCSSSTRGKELVSSRFIPKILLGRPWSLPCVSQMTCRLETAYTIVRRFPQAQRQCGVFISAEGRGSKTCCVCPFLYPSVHTWWA